jgi:hypothetical protein
MWIAPHLLKPDPNENHLDPSDPGYCVDDEDPLIRVPTEALKPILLRKGAEQEKVRPEVINMTLGRLATKFEAAGKVRVFALVDWWTQTALRPLHDYLFGILRTLPSDATFDQEGAIQSFTNEGHRHYYCYDLKSATDLIPREIYSEVMKPHLGEEMTDLWLRLLSDRDFLLPRSAWINGDSISPVPLRADLVRYGRGQPMGALSSWAGLALVHHFLV